MSHEGSGSEVTSRFIDLNLIVIGITKSRLVVKC